MNNKTTRNPVSPSDSGTTLATQSAGGGNILITLVAIAVLDEKIKLIRCIAIGIGLVGVLGRLPKHRTYEK